MISTLINVQYCYDLLIGQIPVGLLLYSHIPTAIIALLFGTYVLIKDRKLASFNLFVVCFSFALWCFFDLSSWFAFLGSNKTMFTWGLVDLFSIVFFFFSYYFLYSFVTEKDLPLWQKLVGVFIMLPTFIWTFFGSNLLGFDADYCEAVESNVVTNYLFAAEAVFILVVIIFIISQWRKSTSATAKRKVLLAGAGVLSFLVFFFSSTLTASILVNYDALADYAYNYEIYGLFGMPILLVYLGYLIVKYKAFDLKVFTTQGLVAALIVLIGSQFFFAQNTATLILVGITFVLVLILGRFLIKSVRREIESRELIEKQKVLLERANEHLKVLDKQKTEFVSLASHQLRAPMTAIKGYATLILDGDYGEVPTSIKEPIQHIFTSTQSLIQIVGDFLDVTRIELGTMKFTYSDFDFNDLVKDVVGELTPNIDVAKLEFRFQPAAQAMPIHGDAAKIKQVLNNLIDNAIKYTKQGWVHVKLNRLSDKYQFIVEDTGVGISAESLPRLFEKFVRAGNANEANVIGTGLGLYVAKQMIEKHNGKIWAESEGEGKGSRFIVEIPAK